MNMEDSDDCMIDMDNNEEAARPLQSDRRQSNCMQPVLDRFGLAPSDRTAVGNRRTVLSRVSPYCSKKCIWIIVGVIVLSALLAIFYALGKGSKCTNDNSPPRTYEVLNPDEARFRVTFLSSKFLNITEGSVDHEAEWFHKLCPPDSNHSFSKSSPDFYGFKVGNQASLPLTLEKLHLNGSRVQLLPKNRIFVDYSCSDSSLMEISTKFLIQKPAFGNYTGSIGFIFVQANGGKELEGCLYPPEEESKTTFDNCHYKEVEEVSFHFGTSTVGFNAVVFSKIFALHEYFKAGTEDFDVIFRLDGHSKLACATIVTRCKNLT